MDDFFFSILAALGLHHFVRFLCVCVVVMVSGGYSTLLWVGFSLWWLLLFQSTGSRARAL